MLDKFIAFIISLFSGKSKPIINDQPAGATSDNPNPAPSTPVEGGGEPDYIRSARGDLGQAEIPGSKSNPYYNDLFKYVLGKDYGDDTSSCMAYVMKHLKKNGYEYLPTAWAADMPKVPCIAGDPKNPQLYQMAIKFSSAANSKRHAFFIVGVNKAKGTVDALGANQGDTVCIKTFSISDLKFVGFPIKKKGTPQPESANPTKPLAWGMSHLDWDSALKAEIVKHDWSGVTLPRPGISTVDCVAQLISIMAKYESSFDPKAKYNETGHLAGVVSRGLLQISLDSANQKAYDCKLTDAQQLHDPIINLQCAVKIMHYQAKKHGVLLNGSKESGAGAYWSVGRSTSKSFEKIKTYINAL